ncbi:hypothetical protein NEOLEDRAFT_1176884 [Neolentinus lepideus HHB14362 ss-1]|uniref:Uncharacterized protein n=1 Tax=Neolentinus lepideus HHB14362 ss-1 TaxID=1314782 RepID=A0A165TRW3_9AGAM|nr:hypothetical protein NEOLEDRAFT_1176884 [Neolentinus lepideus HHB14362 ss-1]
MTKAKQPLADLIAADGDILSEETAASTATGAGANDEDEDSIDLTGLEEVNLLDGLTTGVQPSRGKGLAVFTFLQPA